jgi:N-acetylmuramoyl-L-alanine amidase
MSWRAVILGVMCVVLLGAGCATEPERFAHIPESRLPVAPAVPMAPAIAEQEAGAGSLEIRPVEPAEPPPRAAVEDPGEGAQVVVPIPPVVTADRMEQEGAAPSPEKGSGTKPPRAPIGDWWDLEHWLVERGWSALHPVPHGREVRQESDGVGGTLAVMAGQKKSWWNGTQVWLGFEPRMEKGRLLVHRLDLQSHFEVLMTPMAPVVLRDRSVMIDAGHGGRNAGTRSIAGNRFEKEFTLDWAERLRVLLEGKGWRVVMTRTNDVDLGLAERVALADAAGVSLFVSLHFNSGFPNREAAGLETYTLTPRGMASHVVRDYVDEPGRSFPNNAHDAVNLRLAMGVHRALLATTGQADRGVRHARFMEVLRQQDRPAVLIEGGYLSNPHEAARVQTEEFRQTLAEAVAAGLP